MLNYCRRYAHRNQRESEITLFSVQKYLLVSVCALVVVAWFVITVIII